MPRLTLCALLLFLAGCGAQEATMPDRAAVQARVVTYLRALLAGDGEQACAQLTAAYRHRAESAGLGTCAEVFSVYGSAVTETVPEVAAAAPDARLIVVTVEGDRAEAAMRSPRGGLSVKRTTLRRVGGQWLIDGLGVTRPRR